MSIPLNFGLISDLLLLVAGFMVWFFYFSNLGLCILNSKRKEGVGSSSRIFFLLLSSLVFNSNGPHSHFEKQCLKPTISLICSATLFLISFNFLCLCHLFWATFSFSVFSFSLHLPSVLSHLFILCLVIFIFTCRKGDRRPLRREEPVRLGIVVFQELILVLLLPLCCFLFSTFLWVFSFCSCFCVLLVLEFV